MKILVTGGCGYVGSQLIPMLLDEGHKVTCLDNLKYGGLGIINCFNNPNFFFVKGDARDSNLVSNLLVESDVVIHLAAIVGLPACARDTRLAEEVNLESTKIFLEKMSSEQMFMFGSTGSNYGASALIVNESSPLNPLSVYAQTKTAAEKLVLERHNSVAFRFATAFGISARMRLDLLINDLTNKALRDGYFVVYEPDFNRTFIHVDDLASTFLFGIKHFSLMKNDVFNIGDESMNATKRQVADLIAKKTGAIVEYKDFDKDEDKRDYEIDFSKVRELGFKCSKTLEEGIDQLVKAYPVYRESSKFVNADLI